MLNFSQLDHSADSKINENIKKRYRPIAQFFFIFFLESTCKNKLKSKISEF